MGKLSEKDSGKFEKLLGGGGGTGKIDHRASYIQHLSLTMSVNGYH